MNLFLTFYCRFFLYVTFLFANKIVRCELQPCPENPIVLAAKSAPQYIFSPHDENKNYPPNTDCQFMLKASSANHRIHIKIIESELEEALFAECNDYIIIWDGDASDNGTREVTSWCGKVHPGSITSHKDALLVRFHSDSVVQKRGFNISYSEFELPGCPPDWMEDSTNDNCYKHFVVPYVLPWIEAQRECTYDRSNLATFFDKNEYAFILGIFKEHFRHSYSYPWIGYSDIKSEGEFQSIDQIPLWPSPFPSGQTTEFKDCIFLDWNKRDYVVYEIDDCRTRKAFICKRKKDGSTVPFFMQTSLIRRNLVDSSSSDLLIIFLILAITAILIACIIGCIVLYKHKERRTHGRVSDIDLNHRYVRGIDIQKSNHSKHREVKSRQGEMQVKRETSDRFVGAVKDLADHKEKKDRTTSLGNEQANLEKPKRNLHKELEDSIEVCSPRLKMTPNQPSAGKYGFMRKTSDRHEYKTDDSDGFEPMDKVGQSRNITVENEERLPSDHFYIDGSFTPWVSEEQTSFKRKLAESADTVEKNTALARTKLMHTLPQFSGLQMHREGTLHTTQTTLNTHQIRSGGTTTSRTKSHKKHFERPPSVAVLDNISAISLDEFWQK